METLWISYSENIPLLPMFHSRGELKEQFMKFSPRKFTYGVRGSYKIQQTSSVEKSDSSANPVTARSSFKNLDNLAKDLANHRKQNMKIA